MLIKLNVNPDMRPEVSTSHKFLFVLCNMARYVTEILNTK